MGLNHSYCSLPVKEHPNGSLCKKMYLGPISVDAALMCVLLSSDPLPDAIHSTNQRYSPIQPMQVSRKSGPEPGKGRHQGV